MTKAKQIPTTVKDPELVAQRRAEMVDVATRLFLKNGFHKTSIREIARACSFNVASLYMYVSSKEDILFLVAQHLMNEKSQALGNVRSRESTPLGAFKLAFRKYCEIVNRYRPHVKLLYREMDVMPQDRQQAVLESEIAVQDLFRNIIEEGMRSGDFRPVDAGLVAQNTVFFAHMWSLKHWSLKKTMSFDQFVAAQTEFLLRSIAADGAARGDDAGKDRAGGRRRREAVTAAGSNR